MAAVQLFLVRMQEHHLGAIGMAELEREDGVNPEARGLAARITKQNEADLAAMAEVVTSLR